MKKTLEELKELISDARKRRKRLRWHMKSLQLDYYEKRMWNQSIKVIRRTIRRLEREIEELVGT